ncbi:hypothetical protein HY448_00560 [Candidatus Pacearchaeota archaeon]|nr:hypothetical protein [Candidatus Pacearchaeota archaeon]
METLNQFKFGIAGGITFAVFVLLIDFILWLTLVPLYNNLMLSVYGVPGLDAFDFFKIIIVSLILGFLLGFFFLWLFALVYNKLLLIKVK